MSATEASQQVVKLPPGTVGYLRCNRDVARVLHQLDDPTSVVHLPLNDSQTSRIVHDGIVQQAGVEEFERHDGTVRTRPAYEVSPAAEPWVDEYGDPERNEGPWPRCNHSGLQNHGNDQYGCGNPDCGEVYSRATAEEVQL